MSKTFAQLGIPFSLFEGPVENTDDYVGEGDCPVCLHRDKHCFNLDIGCALILHCNSCGTANGLDASERVNTPCRSCKREIKFPVPDAALTVCYSCLRRGRAAISKDTVLGMISWEQGFEGVTHGVPGLNRNDFEMVPRKDDWVGARLPQEMMFELLRTPTYSTIQGDQWQFCCQRPMVYIGEWTPEDFDFNAPDGDGRRFFDSIVQRASTPLWEGTLHDDTGIYVFRCAGCKRMTAHWDIF